MAPVERGRREPPFCCISHAFSMSASQNPGRVAVVHASGGLRLCRELRALRDSPGSGELDEERFWEDHREESPSYPFPPLYRGDVYFTFGDVLSAVESLSRRIRRVLEGDDGNTCLLCATGAGSSSGQKRLSLAASDGNRRFPQVVGVNIGPSVEYIVAVLAILRSGEAFLPLDPLWPEERTASIAASSNTSLVVACKASSHPIGSFQDRGESWIMDGCKCPVLYFSMMCNPGENGNQCEVAWPCEAKIPRLFCYVLYTSGSTGKPKGVCGTEEGLVNRFLWMHDTFPSREDDVLLFKTSISFIDHFQEFLGAILTCSPLVVPSFNELKAYPFFLLDIIKVYCISRLVIVPSLMKAIVSIKQGSEVSKLHAVRKSLKLLILSGEILSIYLWNLLQTLLPETTILNLYGTTEVSGDCTYFDCKNLSKLLGEVPLLTVPIGHPITNCNIILCSEPQMSDEGEVHVGGSCLYVGYIDDLRDGLAYENGATGLLFRTGDFARRLNTGELVFIGRKDRTIKVNGQRVALEEIEIVLRQHPDVAAAVVTSHKNVADSSFLRAYIVPERKGDVQKELRPSIGSKSLEKELTLSLKVWLLKKQPLAMLPSHFKCIDYLPLLSSGKVDYAMLDNSASSMDTRSEVNGDAVFHNYLQIIKEVFCDALQVEDFLDQEDFFLMGGDSISAAQVSYKLGIDMKFIYHFSSPLKLLEALLEGTHKSLCISRTNRSKRLKAQDAFTSSNANLMLNRVNRHSSQNFGIESSDTSSKHSTPDDDDIWASKSFSSWACSFSRCNQITHRSNSISHNVHDVCVTIEDASSRSICLRELWVVPLKSCVDASPLIVSKDGQIYLLIGSHSHTFLCADALSGVVKWEVKLEGRIECSAAITGDFSQVVVGCYRGKIYFIDLMSGQISWVFKTSGEVKMQPVTFKNLVWCGSHDHSLYALDYNENHCVYKISCGGSLYGSPCIDTAHNMLYVASTSGRVTAISIEELPFHVEWLYECGAPIFGSPCLNPSNGNVIFCIVDASVLVLNPKGSVVWKAITNGPIFAGACLSSVLSSQVLVCSRSGVVSAFALDGGELLWEYQIGVPITSAVYVDEHVQLTSKDKKSCDRLICVCSSSGDIHVLRVSSIFQDKNQHEDAQRPLLVREFAHMKLRGDIFSSPVMVGGRIFVGCRDDKVHCIRIVHGLND